MNTQNLKTVSALQMISVASQLCLGNGVALIKVTKHKVVIMKTKPSNVVTTILSGQLSLHILTSDKCPQKLVLYFLWYSHSSIHMKEMPQTKAIKCMWEIQMASKTLVESTGKQEWIHNVCWGLLIAHGNLRATGARYIIYRVHLLKNYPVINGPSSPQFIFYFSENCYPCRKPISVIENYLVHEEIAVSCPKSPGIIISKADTREVKSASEWESAKVSFKVMPGTDPSHPTDITQHSSYSTRIYIWLYCRGNDNILICPILLAPSKKNGYLKPDVDVIGAVAFASSKMLYFFASWDYISHHCRNKFGWTYSSVEFTYKG